MNAITADARIRIVWSLNKALHNATGVALEATTVVEPEEYEEHAWFVRLDTPTVDGIEYVAIPEGCLALLGENWPATEKRVVAMRGDWHPDLSEEAVSALASHAVYPHPLPA